MHNGTLNQPKLLKKVPGHVMLLFSPKLSTNVSLLVSHIRLVRDKSGNLLEARMLYDKFIEN